MTKFFILLSIILLSSPAISADSPSFVTVNGNHFERNGANYDFVGANLWQGMNLGSSGPGGDRARLARELDRLQKLGVTNLRIMGLTQGPDSAPAQIVPALEKSPGVYDKDQLNGLDFLLSEMKKRKMTATVVLGNYWDWSGGMDQYQKWSVPQSRPVSPATGALSKLLDRVEKRFTRTDTSAVYSNPKAMELYQNDIQMILTRTNSFTGTPYAKDSTIMSWELANEPRGATHPDDFNQWIDQTSKFIKSIDAKHLVTTGTEGLGDKWAELDLKKNNSAKSIDYATVHIWVQNAGWYDPKNATKNYPIAVQKMHEQIEQSLEDATQLSKPLVLEEFGIARDQQSYDPKSSVSNRDQYYKDVFDQVYDLVRKGTPISGVNFWAWGGEASPPHPDDPHWKPGDPFIGDPPHEPQGWYSVFAGDTSTLKVISDAAARIPTARLAGSNPEYAP